MRRTALDTELLLHTAQSNGADNFAIAFHRWADDYVAGNLPSDPGQDPQFTRFATAYFDDLSFAADLTATLARQVYLAHTGSGLAGSDQADADTAAARAAATAWQAQIQAGRAAECGCRDGCRDCRLPRDRDAAAVRAAEIDIQLARAGIPHGRRAITWDPGAGTYALDVTGALGTWHVLIPAGSDPYRAVTPTGQSAVVLQVRTPADIAAELRGLLADDASLSPAGPEDDRDRRQRAALDQAIASGDPGQVLQAARDAALEWSQPGAMWPDNWRLWQQALDDALPPGQRVSLHDLAGAPRPRFDREAASPDMRTAWDLGHLPADQIPAAVARLAIGDVGEIRDILGFQSPGLGIDFGPHAGLAYQACTRRLHGQDGPAEPPAAHPSPLAPSAAPAPAAASTGTTAGQAPEPGEPAAAASGRGTGTPDPRAQLLEVTLGGYQTTRRNWPRPATRSSGRGVRSPPPCPPSPARQPPGSAPRCRNWEQRSPPRWPPPAPTRPAPSTRPCATRPPGWATPPPPPASTC